MGNGVYVGASVGSTGIEVFVGCGDVQATSVKPMTKMSNNVRTDGNLLADWDMALAPVTASQQRAARRHEGVPSHRRPDAGILSVLEVEDGLLVRRKDISNGFN